MARRHRRAHKRHRTRRSMPSILPVIPSQPRYFQIIRFRAQSALSTTIFVRDILNIFHLATTAVTSAAIIGAFKIRKVCIYSIADGGVGSEFNTMTLTFQGGFLGRNIELTSAGSTAISGRIIGIPPKSSAASFWRSVPLTGAISANGEPLFSMSSLGQGVIVDLHIDYTLCDGTSLQGANLTVAGATVGALYTNSLDNSTTSGASGTNSLFPVGRFFLLGFG